MWKTSLLVLPFLLSPALARQEPEPRFAGRPLHEWVADLKAGDTFVRQLAVGALTELGPAAAAAVPALLEALREAKPEPLPARREVGPWDDDDPGESFEHPEADSYRFEGVPDFRADIARALARIGPKAQGTLGALKELMKDPNPHVRRTAGTALAGLREVGAPELLKALEDPDQRVREAAALGLSEARSRGDAVAHALVERLQDPDRSVREAATLALWRMGDGVAPRLRKVLEGGNVEACAAAARALAALGEPEADALLEALRTGAPAARRAAALALASRLGQQRSPELTGALLGALSAADAGVREAAARALGRLQVEESEAANALLGALKDPSAAVRAAAAGAVASSRRPADSAADELERLLQDADPRVRRTAVSSLGELGRSPHALRRAIEDPDPAVRRTAARALGRLKVAAADPVGPLAAALEDSDATVQAAACWALGDLEADCSAAVPALAKALAGPDRDLRSAAARALMKAGPKAAPALDALTVAFQDEDDFVRRWAADVLGGLGEAARPALPALEGLRSNPKLRRAALEVLARIDPGRERTVALLLESDDWHKLEELKKVGFAAAVPALVGALRGPEDAPRERAARLLAFVKPEGEEALAKAIGGGPGPVRLAAVRGAGATDQPGRGLIEALLAATGDPSPELRGAAVESLTRSARGRPDVVAALTRMLADREPSVRWTAAFELTGVPSLSDEWLAVIANVLEDDAPPAAKRVVSAEGSEANQVKAWLGHERARRKEWSRALQAYEAWKPRSFCGNAAAEMEHRRAESIARCHFELGRPARAFEVLEPYLDEQRSSCWCLGRHHAELLICYVELAARAGRLVDARRRLETIPRWMKADYRKALDLQEGAADDPAAVLRALEGVEFEDPSNPDRIAPPEIEAAARRLGRMGAPAVELLARRIARGDRLAVVVSGKSGLADLTVALERPSSPRSGGSEKRGREPFCRERGSSPLFLTPSRERDREALRELVDVAEAEGVEPDVRRLRVEARAHHRRRHNEGQRRLPGRELQHQRRHYM